MDTRVTLKDLRKVMTSLEDFPDDTAVLFGDMELSNIYSMVIPLPNSDKVGAILLNTYEE